MRTSLSATFRLLSPACSSEDTYRYLRTSGPAFWHSVERFAALVPTRTPLLALGKILKILFVAEGVPK
jgi:hypothetical protein